MKKVMLIAALAASSLGLSACQLNAGSAEKSERAERNESSERSEGSRNSAGDSDRAEDGARADSAREGGDSRPAASVSGGDATNQNFTLNNRSNDVITHVYVSAVSNNVWGEDVLGAQVIGAGQAATITFPRAESECNWDVRVTINNDANQEIRNVNLCQTTEVNYQ